MSRTAFFVPLGLLQRPFFLSCSAMGLTVSSFLNSLLSVYFQLVSFKLVFSRNNQFNFHTLLTRFTNTVKLEKSAQWFSTHRVIQIQQVINILSFISVMWMDRWMDEWVESGWKKGQPYLKTLHLYTIRSETNPETLELWVLDFMSHFLLYHAHIMPLTTTIKNQWWITPFIFHDQCRGW